MRRLWHVGHWFWASVVVLWAVVAFRMSASVYISDDYLYLYYCGHELLNGSDGGQEELVELLRLNGATDQLIFRAALRETYCGNYALHSLAMVWTGRVMHAFGLMDPSLDLPRYIAYSLYFGMLTATIGIGVAVLSTLFLVKDRVLLVSLGLALLVIALLNIFAPWSSVSWIYYQLTPSPPAPEVSLYNLIPTIAWALVNPGSPFSLFGPNPRSTVAVITLVVFALRWAGWSRLAYWVVLLIFFVHFSTALLVLLLCIGCDLIVRPRLLTQRAILAAIGTLLLIYISGDQMTRIMNLSMSPPQFAWVAAVLAVVAGSIWYLHRIDAGSPVARRRFRFPLLGLRMRVARLHQASFAAVPLPFADACLLLCALAVGTSVIHVLAYNDLWTRVIYLWSELPLRLAGMIQVTVAAGLVYPVLSYTARYASMRTRRYSLAGGALVLGAFALFTVLRFPPAGVASLVTAAHKVHADLENPVPYAKAPPISDEMRWYYSLLERRLNGKTRLRMMFKSHWEKPAAAGANSSNAHRIADDVKAR